MDKQRRQDREHFVAFAVKHLHASSAEIDRIFRLARRANRYNTAACNRELSPREAKLAEKTDAEFEALVAEIAKREGLAVGVKCKGDPRGYPFKIRVEPDRPYNTWGGAEDGWGVPS